VARGTIDPGHGNMAEDTNSIPKWRLWLYRLAVPVAVPVLLLVGLELGLRVAGYGYPPSAILPCEVEGRASYCSNRRFGQRFAPAGVATEPLPFSFPAAEPGDSYRIFVLGGSAAQGTPVPGFSFSRILKVMLREAYPGASFDVVNVAIGGINSHVVRVIAEDCARVPGDLFVVYLGNNEVIGPFGPGSGTLAMSSSLGVIRLRIALGATRTGQLLSRLAEKLGAGGPVPKNGKDLEAAFYANQVRWDDPRLETTYRNFERNLRDIVFIAHRRGFGTLLCTVGGNLRDHPPFASLHRPDLSERELRSWQELYDAGVALEDSQRYEQAIGRYLEAEKIDPEFADLQFRMARCLEALGRWDEARPRLEKARDLSTLRFRPSPAINDAIRSVAREEASLGARLVDTERVLEQASPHGLPGNEVFLDHVHLNFHGNYLVARAVLEAVERGLAPPLAAKRRRGPLTEEEAAELLAYTDWDRLRIDSVMLDGFFQRALFPRQIYHEQRVERLKREIRDLEKAMTPMTLLSIEARYRQALSEDPSDGTIRQRYAALLEVLSRRKIQASGGSR
jgi:tetratricopeptide (TPR) repeat protein